MCLRMVCRYGERAWTRLEAMSMYAVSILKQVSTMPPAFTLNITLHADLSLAAAQVLSLSRPCARN
jgi:hypothetical protein